MALLRDRGLTLGRWTGRPGARLEKDSGDPDAARMRAAAAAADWPAVRDLLEARPESEDRTGLLWAVGETAGVERWITDVLTAEPESALARTVAGIRYVSWGWEARTAARAKDVSRSQFEVFHSRLRQAEEWLYEVAELEPDWTSPWYVLQVTGRGLEVGQVTARRRFEATVRRHPYHLGAHTQQLQQICEKWGGSHEEMHAFARESVFKAPGGTPLGRLVPDAHIEEWLSLDSGPDAAYMRRPEEVTVVDPHGGRERINDTPPWERTHRSPLARREALTAYCRDRFDFTPLDTIELDLAAAGLRGVAYVLPTAVSPAQRAGHRVHLKGMLLTDQAPELLPDWAFFVRCVVDTTSLRPTASRESLYEDGTLSAVRDALGDRIRDWLTGLAASDPALLHRFIDVHHLAVKALARYDDELLRVVLPWLPFETTDGNVTLEEFARTHPTLLVTRSVEEFRQVAPIAAAAGLGVVNGGYTYDRDLVHRLPEVRPGTSVSDLDPATVTAHLDAVDPTAELRAAAFLAVARETIGTHDCDVVLRDFQPVTVLDPPRAPVLLDNDGRAPRVTVRHERTRSSLAAEGERERPAEPWADILGKDSWTPPRPCALHDAPRAPRNSVLKATLVNPWS
ncbi:hypothetical protein [Streptomyces fradiae]|uniref:hypothetical protein n=1 Tax=Streptomyces fradiae TaxID=1906 RepID=UPI0029436236|nr:hypothetical protein [Streptomyces fradiae]WOI60486.1 hypothetical protein RYQ63_11560 [Streptomyces fradiae]